MNASERRLTERRAISLREPSVVYGKRPLGVAPLDDAESATLPQAFANLLRPEIAFENAEYFPAGIDPDLFFEIAETSTGAV